MPAGGEGVCERGYRRLGHESTAKTFLQVDERF